MGLCCPLLVVFQASHSNSEEALQKRLDEVCEELRATQSRNVSLQASLDKAQQEGSALSGEKRRPNSFTSKAVWRYLDHEMIGNVSTQSYRLR